jgi:hypothetical protein
MRSFFQTLLLILAILVLAVIAELIPPLKQLTVYLNTHPQPYKTITIVASIVGWILFAVTIGYGLWTQGRPMNDDEALGFIEQSAGSPTIRRRFRGRAKGSEFHTEVSFRDIKEAWRSGEWRYEQNWLPVFLGLLAVTLIAFGMFGFFFVIGPPLVKLLCGGALLYATVRTAWAFWKA